MATIDRNTLLADVKFWLPPANTLDDDTILVISELVITQVLNLHNDIPDNESLYEPEIRCKVIEAVARKNLLDVSVGNSAQNLKRQKVNKVEYEWWNKDTTAAFDWNVWIKQLSHICPLFGYTPPRTPGAKVVLRNPIDICPCPTSGPYLGKK